MKKKHWILTVIIIVVMTTAGALAWKMIPGVQKAGQSVTSFLPKGPTPTSAPILLRNNTRPFMGTIVSKEGEKLVIKNSDGTDVTVMVAASTKITGGKTSNLLAGTKVTGVAKVQNDKSMTAQTIQINPQSPLNKR